MIAKTNGVNCLGGKKDDIMFDDDDDDGLGGLGLGDSPTTSCAAVNTSKSEGHSTDFMSTLFGDGESKVKSTGNSKNEFVLDAKYKQAGSSAPGEIICLMYLWSMGHTVEMNYSWRFYCCILIF